MVSGTGSESMVGVDEERKAAPGVSVVGPLELLSAPARRWRIVVVVVLIASLSAGVASFLLPDRYEVSASFVADPGRAPELAGGLASLVGRIGLGDVGLGASSPQFYADLIHSRAILRRALRAQIGTSSGLRPLLHILGVQNRDSLRRVELSERELSRRIAVHLDRLTGRVDLTVSMAQAVTAQSVADTLLSLLDQYNREIRRSRASEKRAFVEAQARMAAESLASAERAMESFLQHNRTFLQSAQLQFEHERLARSISLQQDIYLALARQAEEARIEEVDTRPVITVVDPAVQPSRRAWPRRKLITAGASIISLTIVWLLLVIIELVRREGKGDTDLGRALVVFQEVFSSGSFGPGGMR